MDFWRFLSFVLLELSAAAPIHIPGEVARSSCAHPHAACSRKGRRPLRAGGILLPILDARIHCDGCRSSQRTVLEDIESLFEAAVLNSSLELRPHLATLLEYSKRARSVLQVGTSDTAWIAILQGGLQRSDGQLYQTELAANLMDFLRQHDLRSLGIRVLEGYAASEMLFFSSWRMDFESLAAKSAMAKFILLHGTKYSGENDDGHGSQGTVFFEGLQRWLNNNRAWQLAEYSSLGAGLAVLIRSHRTSRNCSNAWAPAQSFASELLEVRHGYPSLLGSTWHVRPAAVTAMHRRLAAIQSRCPDAKAALRVLQLFSSKDPQMLQGLMESSTTKKYREAIPEPISLGTLDAALNHPELSLLLLHRGQLPDEDRHRLLDVSVAQWPHRFEFWQILADDLVFRRLENVDVPSAMQAIRRCFSLAHFDRSVVFRLLEMLEVLRWPREATLLWDAVAGSPTAPWDDQRRSAASAVSVPQAFAENAAVFPGEAFLNKHPEFKFARDYMEAFSDDLLTEQLDIIRTWSFAALVQLGMLWWRKVCRDDRGWLRGGVNCRAAAADDDGGDDYDDAAAADDSGGGDANDDAGRGANNKGNPQCQSDQPTNLRLQWMWQCRPWWLECDDPGSHDWCWLWLTVRSITDNDSD